MARHENTDLEGLKEAASFLAQTAETDLDLMRSHCQSLRKERPRDTTLGDLCTRFVEASKNVNGLKEVRRLARNVWDKAVW